MLTSIVMTTYNGEKYIEQQLDSIYHQTIQPDEVLIFDDQSTDKTVDKIRKFVCDHELSNWELTINEKNKGWKRNFIEGFWKAHGDIIFPCDQDDVWRLDKIEIMTKEFEKNSNIKLLISSYHLFYTGDRKNQIVNWSHVINKKYNKHQNTIFKLPMRNDWIYVRGIGSSFAFHKSLTPLVKKLWYEEYPHDWCIWHSAFLVNGVYALMAELMEYRRHDANTAGSKNIDKSQRISMLQDYLGALDNIVALLGDDLQYQHYLPRLKRQEMFLKKRLHYIKNKKICEWFFLVSRLGYYNRYRNWISDFLYLVK